MRVCQRQRRHLWESLREWLLVPPVTRAFLKSPSSRGLSAIAELLVSLSKKISDFNARSFVTHVVKNANIQTFKFCKVVAKHNKCGEKYYTFNANFLLILIVKNWKLVNICQSYDYEQIQWYAFGSQCIQYRSIIDDTGKEIQRADSYFLLKPRWWWSNFFLKPDSGVRVHSIIASLSAFHSFTTVVLCIS